MTTSAMMLGLLETFAGEDRSGKMLHLLQRKSITSNCRFARLLLSKPGRCLPMDSSPYVIVIEYYWVYGCVAQRDISQHHQLIHTIAHWIIISNLKISNDIIPEECGMLPGEGDDGRNCYSFMAAKLTFPVRFKEIIRPLLTWNSMAKRSGISRLFWQCGRRFFVVFCLFILWLAFQVDFGLEIFF